MKFVSLCFLLLLAVAVSASSDMNSPEQRRRHHRRKLETLRLHLLQNNGPTISGNHRELSFDDERQRQHPAQIHRTLEDPSPTEEDWSEEIRGGVGGVGSFPRRIRIKPFDLLLAPTPVQLQRGDEDLLLQDVQELVALYIKAQFGDAGTLTNSVGVETTLEYVLFSDIDENAWTKGNNGLDNEYRSILRFNGGVASFAGPEFPPEDVVNEWVEQAINRLLVSALHETRYEYVQHAQYFNNADFNPEDVILDLDFEEEASDPPLLINQAQTSQAGRDQQQTYSIGRNDIPLTTLLASILAGFAVVIVILVFFIHRNNKAVRVLNLDSRENEDVVEFGDQSSVSIKHEREKSTHNKDSDDRDDDDGIAQQSTSNSDDMKRDLSVMSQYAIDEASLQESIASEDFTIPTVSAASMGSAVKINGLSFRNSNPSAKNLVRTQESFQKERKTHLSKDMMFSTWTGKAPNLDSLYGNRRDESVLKPSYFSAAKEWEYMSKGALAGQSSDDDSSESSGERGSESREQTFRVEQAHENGSNLPDGIYVVSPGSSRPKQVIKQVPERSSGDIV